MRILCLSAWWPEPADNGSRLRITHLLDALAQNHEVHFVALSQEPVESLQRSRTETMCASIQVVPQHNHKLRSIDRIASLWQTQPASVRALWNAEFATQVRKRAEEVRPAVVLAFQLAVAPYACTIPGVPRVLDELELAYMLEQYKHSAQGVRRLRAWLTWSKHRRYVSHLLRNFDACTVTSVRERQLAQSFLSHSIDPVVVPNGADVIGCAGPWGQPEPDTLIYPGALSFDANFDAMAYFLDGIFQQIREAHPNARLRITGAADAERRAALPTADGVEFTGYVPDVRPIVARSWCEIVPLRIGGGTRLKVLEALALGTPVVSTPKGVEGLDLDAGHHVLIADSASEFAQTTVHLLGSPSLRARLADAGRGIVQQQYDWQTIGRQLNEILRETATARHSVMQRRTQPV